MSELEDIEEELDRLDGLLEELTAVVPEGEYLERWKLVDAVLDFRLVANDIERSTTADWLLYKMPVSNLVTHAFVDQVLSELRTS